jgi:hypothetical protein
MIPEDLNPKIALNLMLKGIPSVKKQEAKVTPPQTSSPNKTKDQQRSNASESLKPAKKKPFDEMPADYQELQQKIYELDEYYLWGNPNGLDIRFFSDHYLPNIIKQIENTPHITEDQKKDSYRAIFFTSLKVLGLDRDHQLSKQTVENLGEKDDRHPEGNLRQIWQPKINEADDNRGTL